MTWTYASTDVGSSGRSYVRFRVGDTSSGDQLVQDEEIDALIDEQGDKHLAAAVVAESIGAKFARKTDKSVGKLRIAMQQASEHYFRLAQRLRFEAGMKAKPYLGGISESEKDSDAADTDLVQPFFSREQFDFPGDADSSTC